MAFDKVIVLDDELIIRKSLEEQLRRKRYSVASASTIAEAEKLLAKDHFDIIFVDVRLPDGDGTTLLSRLSSLPSSPLVVMMTGYGTIESAVQCMRQGAFDYIIKPFSMEEIDVLIKRAESYSQLVKVNQYFSSEGHGDSGSLVGQSPAVEHLRSLVTKVAATEATVLITGENGTGKEVVAGEVHRLSSLAQRPFIKVNCAAVSESLIESEFFGHEKGAFTGATERREGRFELAHNGTLLLDEIGEIPKHLQAKLLRVLQEREFYRVGGAKTVQVNVRLLATTNRNLQKAVAAGDFREDLYYRLNVFPIVVPPLRERASDIPLLAQTFLSRLVRKHGVKIEGLSPQALEALTSYNWPGNVRELQNTLERAVILAGPCAALEPQHLGLPQQLAPSRGTRTLMATKVKTEVRFDKEPLHEPLAHQPTEKATAPSHKASKNAEADRIREALQGGSSRAQVAKKLGVSLKVLRDKISAYHLDAWQP
jgi:DNA-binding NtrC family response regulator